MPTPPAIQSMAGGNRTTNATTHTVTLPGSISSGNLLIVVCGWDGAPTVTWPGSDYTALFAANTAGSEARIEARYRIATGGEAATFNITTNNSEMFCFMALRITGDDSATTAPTAGGSNSGTSTTPSPASYSPAWGSDVNLWLNIGVYDVGQTFIDRGGFAISTGLVGAHRVSGTTSGPNQRADNADGIGIWVYDHVREAASLDFDGPSINASRPWRAATVAIRPLASSGGGPFGSAFSG